MAGTSEAAPPGEDLLDHLPFPVLEVGPDGRVRRLGRHAAALLALSEGDPAASHPALDRLLRASDGSGVVRRSGVRVEEDAEAVFEVVISPLPDGGRLVSLLDATATTKLTEELAEAAVEGARVERDLYGSVVYLDLLGAIRETLGRHLDVEDAVASLLSLLVDRFELRGAAFASDLPPFRRADGLTTSGWSWPEGLPRKPSGVVREGARLVFPIDEGETTYGALALEAASEKALDVFEAFLSEVAETVAAAFHNVRLHQELKSYGVAVEYLNRELTRANEELRRTVEAKDRLVSTVSHEFRAPLTVIRGTTETLLAEDEAISPAERRRFLTSMLEETDRLARMVDDLLELARLRRQERPPCVAPADLCEVVRRVVAHFEVEARRRGLVLAARTPETPCVARVDRDQIVRALTNLVANAIRYTKRGRVEAALVESDDAWCLTVSDTGVGIPESAREEIFDAFQTAGEEKGVGLGLPITKAIAEAHGGTVELESEVGRGSRFTLRLPKEMDGDEA